MRQRFSFSLAFLIQKFGMHSCMCMRVPISAHLPQYRLSVDRGKSLPANCHSYLGASFKWYLSIIPLSTVLVKFSGIVKDLLSLPKFFTLIHNSPTYIKDLRKLPIVCRCNAFGGRLLLKEAFSYHDLS